MDWCQHTTPQAGLTGIVSPLYPQGHAIGGNSARNFMEYQRGTIGTYQRWAKVIDDESYSWINLLPYFKKSVHLTPPNNATRAQNATPRYDLADFDVNGGPLQVAFPNHANAAGSWISRGFEDLGMHAADGFTDGVLNGWSYTLATIDGITMSRSSSETSFLHQAMGLPPNLLVYTSSLVKRVVFDQQRKATAVEVEVSATGTGSVTYQLNATREIIISAGSFRSPQLLMVSGIGPSSTLQSLGIPVVANLKGVGHQLMDQIYFAATSSKVNVVTHSALGNPEYLSEALQRYDTNRSGILTNAGADMLGTLFSPYDWIAEVSLTLKAFEKLPPGSVSNPTRAALDQNFGPDWPDVQYIVADAYGAPSGGAPDTGNYVSIYVVLVTPFSVGNVTINSTDTKDHPIVNPNWLTDPRDIEVAVAGFKRGRQILASNSVSPIIIG